GTIFLTSILGGYLGSCMMAVLGCWLALHLRGHHLAGYTAGMLLALVTNTSLILAVVITAAETLWSAVFALGVLAFNLVAAPVVARGNALLVDVTDLNTNGLSPSSTFADFRPRPCYRSIPPPIIPAGL
ncbi:MAG: hypothetical protein AVDCRST_MAG93-2225, partial [uncultured Chloroflexia bacterium]